MLLSAVITLDPLDDAAHQTNARQVQRWFKDTLEAADPALFARLHEPNTTRAYTLSAVQPARDGYPAWLRITSLDADLSTRLVEDVLPQLEHNGTIMLDPRNQQARFAITSIDCGERNAIPFQTRDVDLHNPATWAGHTNLAALISGIGRMHKPTSPRLSLEFATCTSFRLNAPHGFKANLPLPIPRYVFQSYLHQWEALAPANLLVPMAPILEHYVWISFHRIRMALESFGGGTRGKTVGFAGRVEFSVARRDDLPDDLRPDWQHYVDMLYLLAAYSFFCGTGIRTTHGLGQTLPLLP